MRQDRGAARAAGAGGDSWRFSRPLRVPPVDLPAGPRVPRGFIAPAQPGRPVTGGPTCFGSRAVQCQRTRHRNPEIAGALGAAREQALSLLRLEAAQNLH